jgi:hypothetical protein
MTREKETQSKHVQAAKNQTTGKQAAKNQTKHSLKIRLNTQGKNQSSSWVIKIRVGQDVAAKNQVAHATKLRLPRRQAQKNIAEHS